MDKYKLINPQETKGVWITESQLIAIIKITRYRSPKTFNTLIEWYEYLNDKKFDLSLLSDKVRFV